MGWMFQEARDTAAKERIVRRSYEFESEAVKTEILALSRVGKTYYMAVRVTPKSAEEIERAASRPYVLNPDGSYVVAGICLTQSARDRFNFGVKELDEASGPYETDCPVRILDMLSPLKAEYDGHARTWRESCRKVKAAKKERSETKARLASGQIIRTKSPIPFRSGKEVQLFKVLQEGRKLRFWTVDQYGYTGYLVRLPGWCLEGVEVVAPSIEEFRASLKEAA